MQELQSRTVWAIIIIVIMSALQSLNGFLEPNLYLFLTTVFGALAVYFRVNPKIDFSVGGKMAVNRKKK